MIREPKRCEYLKAVRNLIKKGVTDYNKYITDVKCYAIMYNMNILEALAIAQIELKTGWIRK